MYLDTTSFEQDIIHYIDRYKNNVNSKIITNLTAWNSEKDFKYLIEIYKVSKDYLNTSYSGLGIEKNFYDELIKLLYRIALSKELNEKEIINLKILCIELFVVLADFYEEIGAVGESFDYLVLALKPIYNINNPKREIQIEFDIETFKEGIFHQIPGALEILLYYCHIYFKVIGILGHTIDEAVDTIRETMLFTNGEEIFHGKKASEHEILYWCSASIILSKSKNANLFKATIKFLLSSLVHRYDDRITLYIIETLIIHHRDHLTPTEFNMIFRKLSSVSGIGLDKIRKKCLQLFKVAIYIRNNDRIVKNILYELLNKFDEIFTDPLLNLMQRQRQSWIINTLVITLLNRHRHELAFECALIWKTYRGQQIEIKNKNDLLLLVIS
jgi:hypothetical protein